MPIIDRNKYRDAAWNWDILGGCFAGKIRPCDIDGVVERRGHFLFIEAKPPRKAISSGQALMLCRLAELPKVTVLIIWGETDQPEEMQVVGELAKRCTLQDVRQFCKDWYERAEQDADSPCAEQWVPKGEA